MASGLPDYLSGVRPEYGGGIALHGNVVVGAGVLTSIVGAGGKGVIYGGAVWMDHTSSQANSIVLLQVDGTYVNKLSFLRMNEYGLYRSRTLPVTLNVYDAVNHIYSVGFSYGITFEKVFTFVYSEEHGQEPTVHYQLCYALL